MVWGKGFDYQSSSDEEGGEPAAFAAAAMNDADDEKFLGNDEDDGPSAPDDDDDELLLPRHFSWIDPTAASKETIAKTFPAFAQTTECRVDLLAGETLYLPASWFHCVTSVGGDDKNDNSKNGKGIHMAINYWYHPPDNLEDFEHPYLTGPIGSSQAAKTTKAAQTNPN